jgi:hypothetical protein
MITISDYFHSLKELFYPSANGISTQATLESIFLTLSYYHTQLAQGVNIPTMEKL